jgi:hypothetical protein
MSLGIRVRAVQYGSKNSYCKCHCNCYCNSGKIFVSKVSFPVKFWFINNYGYLARRLWRHLRFYSAASKAASKPASKPASTHILASSIFMAYSSPSPLNGKNWRQNHFSVQFFSEIGHLYFREFPRPRIVGSNPTIVNYSTIVVMNLQCNK